MTMTETLNKAFLLFFLAACAFQDRRSEKISIILALAGGLSAILCRIFSGRTAFAEIAMGLAPGLFLGLVCALSSGAIGWGDAAMAAVCGLYLGCSGCIVLLLISMAVCAIVAAVLLLSRRKAWKDQMPFAPFLLAGFVLMEVFNL